MKFCMYNTLWEDLYDLHCTSSMAWRAYGSALLPAGSRDCTGCREENTSVGGSISDLKMEGLQEEEIETEWLTYSKGCFLTSAACLGDELGALFPTLHVGLVLPRIQCWGSFSCHWSRSSTGRTSSSANLACSHGSWE